MNVRQSLCKVVLMSSLAGSGAVHTVLSGRPFGGQTPPAPSIHFTIDICWYKSDVPAQTGYCYSWVVKRPRLHTLGSCQSRARIGPCERPPEPAQSCTKSPHVKSHHSREKSPPTRKVTTHNRMPARKSLHPRSKVATHVQSHLFTLWTRQRRSCQS